MDNTEPNIAKLLKESKVKKIKCSFWEAIDKYGEIKKGELIQVQLYTFDKNGQEIEFRDYNDDGTLSFQDNTGGYFQDVSPFKVKTPYYEEKLDSKGRIISMIYRFEPVVTKNQVDAGRFFEREFEYYE